MTDSSDSPTPPDGPVRTCTGCRGKAPRSALVRLVLDGATPRVVVDPVRSAPGRGAWLHPSRDCLDLALRRRSIGRALRSTGPVDTSAVEEWFDQHRPQPSPDAPAGVQISPTRKAGWKPMGTR